MRKLTFISIASVALLCACSTDDTASDEQILSSQQQQQLEINFSPYLGRSANVSTRGSITDATSLGKDGVGIYAMYTKDSLYREYMDTYSYPGIDEKIKGNITSSFRSNFMSNVKVYNENNTWTYNPTRYWPMTSTEFLSFLAYGPYDANTKLYTKKLVTEEEKDGDGNVITPATYEYNEGGGNAIYYKYDISQGVKDIVWNWNRTCNLQLYQRDMFGSDGFNPVNTNWRGTTKDDGSLIMTNSGWDPQDGEHNYKADDIHNYWKVNLKMAHATARVAFVVSCPSLSTSDNYETIPDGQDSIWSGAQITVDTVRILGDFGTSGYLNIANNMDMYSYTTQWENVTIKSWNYEEYNENIKNKKPGFKDDDGFLFCKFSNGTFDTQATGNLWQPDGTDGNLIKGVKETKDGKTTISVNTIGNSANDYLFLIPDVPEQNYICYVAWTVHYRNGTTDEVSKKGIHYAAFALSNAMNIEAGKAYVFNIKIGRSDGGSTAPPLSHFNALHFGVTVENWDNETSVPVFGNFVNGGDNL